MVRASVLVLRLALVIAGCISGSTTTAAETIGLPLERIADVPAPARLGGPTGDASRLDYATIDDRRRLLYIAYLGAGEVVVLDLASDKVIARVPDTRAVHGVLAVPSLGRVYASATGTNEVVAIDDGTQKVTLRAPGGVYPDGIAYDPLDHKLFVSDETGGTDTVIDTGTNRRVDTIDLGGEAGNTQYDPVTRRIYSDVQTRNELAAIDPARDRVVARYPLPGCDHDHGLLIDSGHRFGFVACDGNAKLLAIDMRTMRVDAVFSVGKDPDVLAYDAGLRRLYVASESGVVSVFEEGRSTLRKIGQAFLAGEAHVVVVDQRTHLVYFPLQDVDGRAAIRVMKPLGNLR